MGEPLMLEALITLLVIGSFVLGYLAAPVDGGGGGGGGGHSDDPGPWPELDRALEEWSRKGAPDGNSPSG